MRLEFPSQIAMEIPHITPYGIKESSKDKVQVVDSVKGVSGLLIKQEPVLVILSH